MEETKSACLGNMSFKTGLVDPGVVSLFFNEWVVKVDLEIYSEVVTGFNGNLLSIDLYAHPFCDLDGPSCRLLPA